MYIIQDALKSRLAAPAAGKYNKACGQQRCRGSREWCLRVDNYPEVVIIVCPPGQQKRYFPDVGPGTGQHVVIGEHTYDLRVVHCALPAHHVAYFHARQLHQDGYGWYFYDDLDGRVWFAGESFRMWHLPTTIECLMYMRRQPG